MQTGQPVKTLSGHANNVNGIAQHPTNPAEFVSYSQDGSFIVYMISGNEEV
jgi:hypothetical protein